MFKYEKRYKYPHMKPNDVAIWERFIDQNPNFFESVDYDVLVGSKPNFDATVNKETGGNDTALYQKKIDVVGYKNGELWIVEVKPNAGMASIGQAKSYEELYKAYRNPEATTIPAILTDNITLDMPMLAHKMGVVLLKA